MTSSTPTTETREHGGTPASVGDDLTPPPVSGRVRRSGADWPTHRARSRRRRRSTHR